MSHNRLGVLRQCVVAKSMNVMQKLRACIDFNTIPKAANWLNVAGMVCSMLLLLSFIVLPVQKTNRHYLTIGLVVAICFLQVRRHMQSIRQKS